MNKCYLCGHKQHLKIKDTFLTIGPFGIVQIIYIYECLSRLACAGRVEEADTFFKEPDLEHLHKNGTLPAHKKPKRHYMTKRKDILCQMKNNNSNNCQPEDTLVSPKKEML